MSGSASYAALSEAIELHDSSNDLQELPMHTTAKLGQEVGLIHWSLFAQVHRG